MKRTTIHCDYCGKRIGNEHEELDAVHFANNLDPAGIWFSDIEMHYWADEKEFCSAGCFIKDLVEFRMRHLFAMENPPFETIYYEAQNIISIGEQMKYTLQRTLEKKYGIEIERFARITCVKSDIGVHVYHYVGSVLECAFCGEEA